MAFIYLGLGTLGTFAYPAMSIGLQSKSCHRQNAFRPRYRRSHARSRRGPSDPGDPWIGPQNISWGISGVW